MQELVLDEPFHQTAHGATANHSCTLRQPQRIEPAAQTALSVEVRDFEEEKFLV